MKKESKLSEEQQEILHRFRDHLAHVWEAYHVVDDIHKIAEQANDKQQIHLEWFARIFLRYLVVTVLQFFDDAGGTVAKSAFVNQANIGKQNLSLRFLKDNLKGCTFLVEEDVLKTQTEESRQNLKHLRNKYLAHNSINRNDQKVTDNEAKEHIKILLDYCDQFCEKIDPTMGSLKTAAGRRCFVQQSLNIGVQLRKYPKLYQAIRYPNENESLLKELNNGLQLSKYPKLSQAIRYPDEKLLKKLNSVAEDWPNN